MLTKLGRFIEKKPWVVVAVVILITIGFATLLPSLEFKTDFSDFMPDDEIALANKRVGKYFGTSDLPMFALIEAEEAESVITVQSIRDIYHIEQELMKNKNVEGMVSLATFINPICLVEFGRTIEYCTDEQIQIAINDLLKETQQGELRLFTNDDPNEAIDYKRFPRLSRGESIDSADLRNCYISKNNETVTFSFEVYDLSDLKNSLKPSLTKVNVMEWYLNFENLIKPNESLDISYRIAAHIEPSYPIWEVGKGFLENFREIINHIRNRELLNSYKSEAYLWIRPPGESMYFPLPLSSGNITFEQNRINVKVSREELGQFGIATQIGTFELPAKLANFSAGVRYYQQGIFNRPGGRVVANLSFLFDRLERLRNRPILGSVASSILQRFSGMTWEDFDQLFELMEQTQMLPETLALKDFDNSWISSDVVPDSGVSQTEFFILPFLFKDLQLNSFAFLSEDYEETGSPQASLIIIQFEIRNEPYDKLLKINEIMVTTLADLDKKYSSISIVVTGELVVTSQINELTTEANQILGPAMFFMIVIILFISFRRTSYVLLPLLALMVSTIWLFGTMILLGIDFNVIAVALVPLILGLGVDYSVHLFHNYRTELEKGRAPAEAIKRSVKDIGTAMFLAWLTTVIAFMSFLSSSIQPIREFGILLALGVTYAFITSITLLASTRYLLDRRKTSVIKKKFSKRKARISLRDIMGKISSIVLCHQKKMIVGIVLITLFLAIGAAQLEKGFDMDQFIPADNPAMELFDTIAEYFPFASEYQEYILIEGDVATVATLKGIAQTHEKIEDDTFISKYKDGSVKVVSIYSEIVNSIKNNNSLVEKFNIDETTSIPKTDQDVKALFDYLYAGTSFSFGDIDTGELNLEDFGSGQIQTVLYENNSKYSATLIRYYLDASFQLEGGNLQDDLNLLCKEMNDDLTDYGDAGAIVTGISQIQLNNTNSLTNSQFISTGISILLAAFVLIITYRNPTLGLITMIPVGITIVWILGTMYYLGYILDVMTVTVTSITIGIGIDYAIHATHRFRLVADRTGDINKAVCETISHTGGALLIAALTTALAFGILILAPIPPQQRFGIILALTITYSFLISVLFLPLFLARWAKWRKKRKGFIISPGPPREDIESD